jgi:hypothetical protein
MSRITIVLAAVLGCAVLFAVWMRNGEEMPSSTRSSSEHAGSMSVARSSLPERQRPRSFIDRPEVSRDRGEQVQPEDDATDRGEVVVESDLERSRNLPGRSPRLQAGLDAIRQQAQKRSQIAGVVHQGQLSRRQPGVEDTGETEHPPLRAPRSPDDAKGGEDTVEHWRDIALGDPDPDQRTDALSELDLDDPAAMDVLIAALDDRDSDVRLAALGELWVHSDEAPTNILARLLNDPDPEVRLEVVGMLAESEDPYARQLLRGALTDTDEDVRDEASTALELD